MVDSPSLYLLYTRIAPEGERDVPLVWIEVAESGHFVTRSADILALACLSMTDEAQSRTPPNRRLAGVAAIAFSSIAWWPAFTLGAWGTVFFEQAMSLWAAATAAFVLVMLVSDVRRRIGWWSLTLLVPTAWLLLALEVQPGTRQEVALIGTGVTLLGLPAMVYILIRFASPDLVEDAEPRDRIAVVTAVAIVVIGAYFVGTQQDRLLTCGDFTISGNSEPPGCTPGEPSLDVLPAGD